jgi:thiol-disulfide isomerase/thioredoxin
MKKTFELKRCQIDMILLFIIFIIGAVIAFRRLNGKVEKYYDLEQSDLTELFTVESVNNCEPGTKNNKGRVILFYTEWCGASKSFMGIDDRGKVVNEAAVWPELKDDEQFTCEKDKIAMHQVDCDTKEGSDIATKFNVKYLPSLFFVTKEWDEENNINISTDMKKQYKMLGDTENVEYNNGVFKYTGELNYSAIKNFITGRYNES